MVSALAVARDRDWISDETAMRLLYASANAQIDVDDERARIALERAAAHAGAPRAGEHDHA